MIREILDKILKNIKYKGKKTLKNVFWIKNEDLVLFLKDYAKKQVKTSILANIY